MIRGFSHRLRFTMLRHCLQATALIQVGNDHRLADQEPLAAMPRACGLH
jgi:hypothetical protein